MNELGGIVTEAGDNAAAENWEEVEGLLLDYVAGLVELEGTMAESAASNPGERPFPVRYHLAPVMDALSVQGRDLAGIWRLLPEDNRAPVADAVRSAAEASDHPAFRGHLVRLVRGELEPPDLDLGVCVAMVARDEFAIEKLEEALAELGDGAGL